MCVWVDVIECAWLCLCVAAKRKTDATARRLTCGAFARRLSMIDARMRTSESASTDAAALATSVNDMCVCAC
jgi:hypothetical protein